MLCVLGEVDAESRPYWPTSAWRRDVYLAKSAIDKRSQNLGHSITLRRRRNVSAIKSGCCKFHLVHQDGSEVLRVGIDALPLTPKRDSVEIHLGKERVEAYS